MGFWHEGISSYNGQHTALEPATLGSWAQPVIIGALEEESSCGGRVSELIASEQCCMISLLMYRERQKNGVCVCMCDVGYCTYISL